MAETLVGEKRLVPLVVPVYNECEVIDVFHERAISTRHSLREPLIRWPV